MMRQVRSAERNFVNVLAICLISRRVAIQRNVGREKMYVQNYQFATVSCYTLIDATIFFSKLMVQAELIIVWSNVRP